MQNNRRRRVDWGMMIAAIIFVVGCDGGGCGAGCAGTEPIPGGFPTAKRNPNAVQLRVSSGALGKIMADPAAVIGPLLGGVTNGVVELNIPASCGGTNEICCVNGQPAATCGPLLIDLVTKSPSGVGSEQRLALTPVQGAAQLDLTLRARVRTKAPIRVAVTVPVLGKLFCNEVSIDSTHEDGANPDLVIQMGLGFPQDATTSTTRINANTVTVGLEGADLRLGGFCSLGQIFVDTAIGFVNGQLRDQIRETVNGATCKACESGQVAECGSSFATACTNKVCQVGDRCLQEVGMTGRMRGGNVLASLSPGTLGAFDLYEVLGGYAKTDGGGLGLGMLGGMEPGGAPRDRCGPPATAPAKPTIAQSIFFQGNTRPDTSAAFDVAIGLHASQLTQFAYAAYDGGFLCLTINGSTIPQLSTDTLSLISRSLGNLNGENAPMAVGLRPQSPPTITLGKNTFTTDAMGNSTLTEPLLDLAFKAMEIDFFAAINDQYVRVFTVVADVQLPVGLQVTGMGELQPVLGEIENAFTNLSVKNSEAVTEDPAQLAALFPNVLNLVLPQLSGGLSPIALPALGGLELAVSAVTATPQAVGGTDKSYLSIFANLNLGATVARPVNTQVSLGEITRPDAATMKTPARWQRGQGPTVQLSLGDRDGLEYSVRIDSGSWSPWSTNRTPVLRAGVFWLPATHDIEVRARAIGRPETIDLTPATLEVDFRATTVATRTAPFHGQGGKSGCSCETSSASGAGTLFLVFMMMVMPVRRVRRRFVHIAKRLGWTTWLAAIALLPGCSCGSDSKCGEVDCLPGEVSRGSVGHWTSIAGDDERVMVATYDQALGDLVAIDVTDAAQQKFVAVDGVPDVDAVYDGDYRGGIEEPGDDVGAFTSIALSDGHAMVAYQDRDAGALKFAYENKPGSWATMVIDDGDGGLAGQYASLAIDRDGKPVIAYVVTGLDDGTSTRAAELRIVRASSKDPRSADRWGTPQVVSKAPSSCGGLCAADQACIAGMMSETCAPVASSCAPGCAAGEACVAGACTATILEPEVATIGSGTGLFAQLVVLADGNLAVVYYNHTARSLEIAVEAGGAFTVTTLDGGTTGDRGMWSRAIVDSAGTVHIAYQDALGDQLLYTTWAGSPGVVEVVDDGSRSGDRTHPVGAGATIYIANGTPTIAYQDGATADVYVAAKGAGWTIGALASGPLLDGFWIAGTTAHEGSPVVAWGSLDPSATPLGTIVVQKP